MKTDKQIIIKEEEYDVNKQASWEKTVIIVRWEHDYEKHIYVIDYNEKK
jgi:hypothetical protein